MLRTSRVDPVLKAAMGQSIPIGWVGSNQAFENAVVAAAKLAIWVPGSFGGGDLEKAQGASRQKDPEKNRNRLMADQEGREGVHGKRMAEKGGNGGRGGDALIPEQGETPSLLEMAERPARDVFQDHLHSQATA